MYADARHAHTHTHTDVASLWNFSKFSCSRNFNAHTHKKKHGVMHALYTTNWGGRTHKNEQMGLGCGAFVYDSFAYTTHIVMHCCSIGKYIAIVLLTKNRTERMPESDHPVALLLMVGLLLCSLSLSLFLWDVGIRKKVEHREMGEWFPGLFFVFHATLDSLLPPLIFSPQNTHTHLASWCVVSAKLFNLFLLCFRVFCPESICRT